MESPRISPITAGKTRNQRREAQRHRTREVGGVKPRNDRRLRYQVIASTRRPAGRAGHAQAVRVMLATWKWGGSVSIAGRAAASAFVDAARSPCYLKPESVPRACQPNRLRIVTGRLGIMADLPGRLDYLVGNRARAAQHRLGAVAATRLRSPNVPPRSSGPKPLSCRHRQIVNRGARALPNAAAPIDNTEKIQTPESDHSGRSHGGKHRTRDQRARTSATQSWLPVPHTNNVCQCRGPATRPCSSTTTPRQHRSSASSRQTCEIYIIIIIIKYYY